MPDLPLAALAFLTTLGAGPMVLWVLRRFGVLDQPTPRSSHRQATPRGGGLAPALGCIVAALLATRLAAADRAALLLVAGGMGLIGLIDDLHPLGARPRLWGQLAVAGLALPGLTSNVTNRAALGVAGAAVAVAVVGYVNAFNFMDGINGLAVAQVVVAGVVWWIIGSEEHVVALASAGAIVAAAGVAFAPFNLPRARMFLGDVGSYFLGGWVATAAIFGLRAGMAPEAVLAPLALYVADTSATLVRRLRRHESWSQPHREHVYQRLVQAGWSHSRTTFTVAVVMASVSALGALSLTSSLTLRAAGDLLALLVLSGYLVLPARRVGSSVLPVSLSGPPAPLDP